MYCSNDGSKTKYYIDPKKILYFIYLKCLLWLLLLFCWNSSGNAELFTTFYRIFRILYNILFSFCTRTFAATINALRQLRFYMQQYLSYEDIWSVNKTLFFENYNCLNPLAVDFDQDIAQYDIFIRFIFIVLKMMIREWKFTGIQFTNVKYFAWNRWPNRRIFSSIRTR